MDQNKIKKEMAIMDDKVYDEEPLKLSAMRNVLKKSAEAMKDPMFMHKCMDEFMRMKINQFPALCAEVRRVNHIKKKQFDDIGNTGGWSESKDFKFDFSIPQELYNFMVNLVYREFWAEEHEKTWRQFMDGIMSGDDPSFLLYRAKLAFAGSEQDHKIKVTD